MFASKFPSLRCGISAVYLSVLRVMKGLTTGVRASLRYLLPLQQRRVICEIRVSRSTNHRAFRTSFRKIPFRTFAFRRLPIAFAFAIIHFELHGQFRTTDAPVKISRLLSVMYCMNGHRTGRTADQRPKAMLIQHLRQRADMYADKCGIELLQEIC